MILLSLKLKIQLWIKTLDLKLKLKTKKCLFFQIMKLQSKMLINRKQVPGVKIKKQISKNKYQKLQEEEQKILELKAAEYYMTMNYEVKQNVGTAVYQKSYLDPNNMTEKQKLVRMFHLFRKMDKLGPGAYNIQKDFSAKVMVTYRSQSPTKARVPQFKRTPGPAHYYAKDDMCFKQAPVINFTKDSKQKIQPIDKRDFLDVNVDQIKEKWPTALIFPEHSKHQVTYEDLLEIKRGPGQYDPKFDIIEARNDIGVVKFQEINEKNDRANNIHEKKEINDAYLEPNYDFEKPGITGQVKYHEDTNIIPAHVPDKELFPERWEFYDQNYDAIKELIGKVNNFAQNLEHGEFQDKEREREIFLKVKAEHDKHPDFLQYSPDYAQIDKHVPDVNFEKQADRDALNVSKVSEELDLNPEKPKAHIAGVNFEKQVGRPESLEQEEECLILDPIYDLVKPAQPCMVQIDKQLSRPHTPKKQEEELLLHINYDQVEKKAPEIDFQSGPEKIKEIEKVEQELILDIKHDQVEKTIVGTHKMLKPQAKVKLRAVKNFK